jgi:hypothetical protein
MPSGVPNSPRAHRTARYNGPDRSPRFTRKEDPYSVSFLKRKLRSCEIRLEMLSKCEVIYDGWSEDVAQKQRELQDLRDLLKQAA